MAGKKKVIQEDIKDEVKIKKVAAYTKMQILESKKYRDRRDLVNALLKEDNMYSIEDIDTKINKFMKGKVR